MIVLKSIKGVWARLVCAGLLLASLSVQGHPGRTDAEGCHAGTQPRHCHGDKQSRPPAQESDQASPRTTGSEEDYNRRFCATVNGETETRHGYTYAGGRSYVMVDCETTTTVYEGGLDKRSSLDSLQQALFFSHVTGKRPAVVIYDTDGREGRFEYRIRSACEKAGVQYRVFQ